MGRGDFVLSAGIKKREDSAEGCMPSRFRILLVPAWRDCLRRMETVV